MSVSECRCNGVSVKQRNGKFTINNAKLKLNKLNKPDKPENSKQWTGVIFHP